MTGKKRPEFSAYVRKKVLNRSGNRCERCGIDFDEDYNGEFHHIKPTVLGGDDSFENCVLLCHNCHHAAPNVRDECDLLIFKYYFMRFASFKEAAEFYNVDTRFELYTKIGLDIAKRKKIS